MAVHTARPWRPFLRECRRGSIAAALAGMAALPAPAAAQVAVDPRMERDTVGSRARPGFEAMGIAFGGFTLRPEVTVAGSANDNIYARRDAVYRDVGISLRPAVSLQSRWSRHALSVSADASVDRYASRTSENVARWTFAADGRLDLGPATRIGAGVSLARKIEPRGSSGDTLFGAAPIAYVELDADLGVTQDFGRTRIRASGRFQRWRYADRRLGGATIDLSARNFETVSGQLRVEQGLSPGFAAFASGEISGSRFPDLREAVTRDSNGYAALAGVVFGVNRLLQGEIGVGYVRQEFVAGTVYPRITGLNYRVQLKWSPTRLTTVRAVASRSFQRGPIAGVAGVVQHDATLSAEHELLRNLLVRPAFGYHQGQLRGGVNRRDRFFTAQLGAQWLLGPHVSVDGTYYHNTGRNSRAAFEASAAAREYDQNRFVVALTWRY